MKRLFAILLLLPALVIANPYDYVITKVIDGDTVKFQATFLPPELGNELSLRIYGVDTPEKGRLAQCPAENLKGIAATEFTKAAVNAATKKQIVIKDWDKYGGRVLGDLYLDGKNLSDMLISAGLARAYFGDKKTSWCN